MASSPKDLAVSGRTPVRADLEQLQGLDLQASYQSARTGGDFFDAVALASRVIILLSDIAGRLSETAPIAAEVQPTFRNRSREFFSTPDGNESEALVRLAHAVNDTLIKTSNGVRFAPTFLGCYNLPLSILTYINSGGQTAVFRDGDGTRILKSTDMPLGLFTHMTHEPSMQAFDPGARLVIVTKGVIESRRGRSEFGVERVRRLIQDSKAESAAELCRETLKAAGGFSQDRWSRMQNLLSRGSDGKEDLTVVALIRPTS